MPNSQIQSIITDQALANGVPPQIALAVAQQESSFNPNAVGAAGEIGLFQIMPATGLGLGYTPESLTDPATNAEAGTTFLSQLYATYGNWTAALSAYNSGNPTGSLGYANSVLSIAGGDPDAAESSALDLSSTDWPLILGGVALLLGFLWWMEG